MDYRDKIATLDGVRKLIFRGPYPMSRTALSDRNIRQATSASHICSFKVSGSHIKKGKKKEVKLISIIYLTQYAPNIIISTDIRYLKITESFHILFSY